MTASETTEVPPRTRCSCSFPHPPHDWCDGNPMGEEPPQLFDPASLTVIYPGPRVRRESGWCANALHTATHPACEGIGVPTWEGGGAPERCQTCEDEANGEPK